MKNFLLLSFFSLLMIAIIPQQAASQLLYAKAIGTPGNDLVRDAEPSSDGQSYFVAGETTDTTGNMFSFVYKMDISGNMIWKKAFNIPDHEARFDRIFENSDGELIVTGMHIPDKQCGLFLKLSSTGDLMELKRYQLSGPHTPTIVTREMVQNSDHGYAMIGYAGLGFSDWIIMWMRTDSFGNALYHHQYGNLRDDHPIALFHDSASGYFMVTRVGNGFNEHAGFVRIYHLDSAGIIVTTRNIKPSFKSDLTSCIQTSDGSFLLCGNSSDSSYLMKLDASFNVTWIKHYPATKFQSVTVQQDGSIWLTGRAINNLNIIDYTITKTTSSGEVIFSKELTNYCTQDIVYDFYWSIPRSNILAFSNKTIFTGTFDNCSAVSPYSEAGMFEVSDTGGFVCNTIDHPLSGITGAEPEISSQVVFYNDSIDFITYTDTLFDHPFGEIYEACVPTTVNSPITATEISIFPNPATTDLRINLDKNYRAGRIIDNLGRTIFSIQPGQMTVTINVQNWEKGIYWLYILDKNKVPTVLPIALQ